MNFFNFQTEHSPKLPKSQEKRLIFRYLKLNLLQPIPTIKLSTMSKKTLKLLLCTSLPNHLDSQKFVPDPNSQACHLVQQQKTNFWITNWLKKIKETK